MVGRFYGWQMVPPDVTKGFMVSVMNVKGDGDRNKEEKKRERYS